MCGRYFLDEAIALDIKALVKTILPMTDLHRTGDILPSQKAVVVTGGENGLIAEDMRWGFTVPGSKQLLINARSESVLSKKLFSESALKRRIVIPAGGFYEWDRLKQKYTFTRDDHETMYMGGFYHFIDDEYRFVILTTGANDSMTPVHDRMPLIFEKTLISDWVYDDERVKFYLERKSPMLHRETDYEQLTLF